MQCSRLVTSTVSTHPVRAQCGMEHGRSVKTHIEQELPIANVLLAHMRGASWTHISPYYFDIYTDTYLSVSAFFEVRCESRHLESKA